MDRADRHADFPLDWVDGFVESIRPYVRVRQRDRLLILVPNQAYKLNRTGLTVLGCLLDGGHIADVQDRLGDDPAKRRDLFHFFADLRALVNGCLGEGRDRKAVDRVPFQTPFNELPVLSEIAVTYRCNLRCAFCYANCTCSTRKRYPDPWKKGPGTFSGPEMTTDEVRRVLRIIAREAQVPSVSFTGGEPTLRGDLDALIAYARGLDLRVNLITNGTTAEEGLVRRLAGAGLNSVQVSLEGPSAQVHDAITGVPGSFERTVRGIKSYRAAGLHTHTNTTINRLNLEAMPPLVRFIKELGLDRFSMNLVIPAGRGSQNDEDLSVSYTEIGPIVEALHRQARELGLEFMWYSPTPMCLFNPIARGLGNKSCAACDGLLSIAPDGRVLPCSSYPEDVGNVLTTPFREIWNGPRARWFQQGRYAPRECQGCEELTVCRGACPLYWRKHGCAELMRESTDHVAVAGR